MHHRSFSLVADELEVEGEIAIEAFGFISLAKKERFGLWIATIGRMKINFRLGNFNTNIFNCLGIFVCRGYKAYCVALYGKKIIRSISIIVHV